MRAYLIGLVALTFVSCAPTVPRDALLLRGDSLAVRQLQTRKFDTKKEKDLLIAAAGVLQDLGFNIDESETEVGLIVGSKNRDATDTGQIIGAVIMAALLKVEPHYDKEQKIRASVVTRENSDGTTSLRVTFQRMVWNTRNDITKAESLEDPKLYQEFFDKLSKSVFLEAQAI